MPSSSSRKGSRLERELVDTLNHKGWTAVRCGASGSATSQDRGDILAVGADAERTWLIEAKASSPDRAIYVGEGEVEQLRGLCRHSMANAIIAVRWDRDRTWYLYHPAGLHQTDGGRYRVKHDYTNVGEIAIEVPEEVK